MTAHHNAAAPPARLHIAGLARNAGRKLSDRIHATADDRAQANGWQVTTTRGPFGLQGRSYRDPRFGARRQAHLAAPTGRTGRHD
jgi:hypothetical protein